jgi:hypothetical protein
VGNTTDPVPSNRGHRARPLPLDDLTRAIERYQAGEKLSTIAGDYGFSRGFLTKQFREAGVTIRHHPMSGADITYATYLYGTGESLVAIGERLGYNSGTVWHALRKANVPMRKAQERSRKANHSVPIPVTS